MASYAGANKPVSNSRSSSARRLGQFPPVPKSVRVVSVFSEAQPVRPVESPASATPETRSVPPWALWLLGLTVISGLTIAALFGARFWNQLPI
jgi:hypothetical protein